MGKPPYKYDKNGDCFFIYKMTYRKNSEYGSKISDPFFCEEDARKETYRLNGWEYTPKIK